MAAMEQAVIHCTEGVGIWQWASNDQDAEPDVVMACCGDTPTLEVLAAVSILREHLPDLKIRVINVVDLMRLQPCAEHPHGLSETDYNSLFTRDKPIIFNFHGYPSLVHGLTYRRTNRNLHVRGYKEEGTITTAFDMRVQNDIDRFHLVQDVVDQVAHLGSKGTYLKQAMRDKLIEHKHYIDEHGEDLPEIRNWKWGANPKLRDQIGPSEMPIKINETSDEKFLVVHVWGKLVRADYERFLPQFAELSQRRGKLRLLFDMIGFEGWDAGALYDELKFDLKHANDFDRVRDGRRQQMGACHGDHDQTVHQGEHPILRRNALCRCARMVERGRPRRG